MKSFLPSLLLTLIASTSLRSQVTVLYQVKKDSSGFELTEKGASLLAALPLKCIVQPYPSKTGHVVNSDSDQLSSSPRQLHPVFYGCFDWHSSVHGHWMLVTLLKKFPRLTEAAQVRDLLNNAFTANNIQEEINYFNKPLAGSFERTYGWAWLLKLDQELYSWNDADAQRWHQLLMPLSAKIISLWKAFLPKQTYPNRTGVHPNTAFGLGLALDYSRAMHDSSFEKILTAAAMRLYKADKNAPSLWEPDGSDFFSPSLEEADLMARVLSRKSFSAWFNQFFSASALQHLTLLPVISDRTDLQIVHLDGLCFSRSWCMRNIAAALPATDARKKLLHRVALQHLQTALPNVVSGNYGGEHWLASFAVFALLE
jgi:hypothetical protein